MKSSYKMSYQPFFDVPKSSFGEHKLNTPSVNGSTFTVQRQESMELCDANSGKTIPSTVLPQYKNVATITALVSDQARSLDHEIEFWRHVACGEDGDTVFESSRVQCSVHPTAASHLLRRNDTAATGDAADVGVGCGVVG